MIDLYHTNRLLEKKKSLMEQQLLHVWICTKKNILLSAKPFERGFTKLHFLDSQLTGSEYLKTINTPSPVLQFMPAHGLPAKRYLSSKKNNADKKGSLENRCLCFRFKKVSQLMLQTQGGGAGSPVLPSLLLQTAFNFSHLPHLFTGTRSRPCNSDHFQAVLLRLS